MEKKCLVYDKEKKECIVRQIRPEESLLCSVLKKKSVSINEFPFYNSNLICEKFMNSLTVRERKVIELRYGFNGVQMTNAEIATEFNVSEERIKHIYELAMKRLRGLEIDRFWLNAGYKDSVLIVSSEVEVGRYHKLYNELKHNLFGKEGSYTNNQYVLESENITVTISYGNDIITNDNTCSSIENMYINKQRFTHITFSINDIFESDIIITEKDEEMIEDIIVKYLLSEEVPYIQLCSLDIPKNLFNLLVSLGYVYAETAVKNMSTVEKKILFYDNESKDTLKNIRDFLECCKLKDDNSILFSILSPYEYNYICKSINKANNNNYKKVSNHIKEIVENSTTIKFLKNEDIFLEKEESIRQQKTIKPLYTYPFFEDGLIIDDSTDLGDNEIIIEE